MSKKIRVVLADDHPVVLAGLCNIIQAEPDLELVGQAANGLAALKVIREQSPDLSVLDISMPEMNGILLSRRLAQEMPAVRVILLTLHEDRAYVKQALAAGVRGYVLKRSAAENLLHAIRAVSTCGLYVDPGIATRVFDAGSKRGGRARALGMPPDLTVRETEVVKLIALGYTNKEIARRLDIGVKSVETYKARGLEKLGLRTRAGLVRYASTQGWLADI